MPELMNTIMADGPSSNPSQPVKALLRAWGTWVEGIITAFLSNGGLIYDTKAHMDADLAHGANSSAWVVGDPTVANNGIYRKLGASGAGSWTRVADLPYSYIRATDAGAGTPNAIIATSTIPLPSADGGALINFIVFEANTASPVTVAFNGGAALTIKTSAGNDVVPGGLVAGMVVAGYKSGSTFRLLSDPASAAIQAAAEAAAAAAIAAAATINLPATTAGDKGKLLTFNGAGYSLSLNSGASVFAYGTVDPTGGSDSSAAFQAAAAAGKAIIVPPGTYKLSSTINITLSGTRFIGAGRGNTVITTYSTGHGFSVASGLSYIEFSDFTLNRNGVPTSNAQNGIHFAGITERARVTRIEATGHWHNYRMCATSLSKIYDNFSDNAYGNGYYITNEDAVAAGLQWEVISCFAQRSNDRGIKYFSNFGTSAVVGPLVDFWSYANKLGGIAYMGTSGKPINGVRIIGGFSGEEGGDSLYIDTYGTTESHINGLETEINGSSAVGVNKSIPAPNVGRGITLTSNNTAALLTGCVALGHSYSGIVTSCPRITITGCTARNNGAAEAGGEQIGIYLAAGRAVVTGCSSLGHDGPAGFGIYAENDTHIIVGNDVSESNTTPIGATVPFVNSFVQDNFGATVFSPRDIGWTAGTGTANKGAYATYGGQTHAATYSQSAIQAVDNALVNASRRVLSLEAAMRAAKLIN
ncbi:hypothetical protein [Mesorhizobium sp. ORM16]|uniref:hypothetical protein n=1 Tax=Mesorhizobium sp. ORM16 TaxID=3376989 RepID=UPI003857A190